jgi:hypothetical protein
MEYTVTVKLRLSLIGDSRAEVDSDALEYCQGLMCVVDAQVLDIEEAPEDPDPA